MQQSAQRHNFAFAIITVLFFMWGFMTALNDILVPYLKKMFELNYTQGMLVQFCFFGAFFIVSLIYYLISLFRGDPISRIGYKNGIILSLLICAIGCIMFYMAGTVKTYGMFLSALFVLATGITILQIAANPYAAILGSAESASSRLNLSQAFNSLGTVLAPLVGGRLILQRITHGDAVQMPYLWFTAVFVLLALMIFFTPLPSFTSGEKIERGLGALRFPHLRFGMIAIFCYVGAEVAIGSVMISYLGLPKIASMKDHRADAFVSFYWCGLMIGRFAGAVALKEMKNFWMKTGLMIGLAMAALLITLYSIKQVKGYWIEDLLIYGLLIAASLAGLLLSRNRASSALSIFAGSAILLVTFAAFLGGHLSMWLLIGVGLFNSIMWSNIFTLAIDGLGKYTAQGSSLLVMMICGGAFIPMITGALADRIGLHHSILVVVVCYAYLLFYGLSGYKAGRR